MDEPQTPGWRPPNHIAKWLPAFAAAGLLGTVVLAGVALGGGSDNVSVSQTELADSAVLGDPVVSALTVPDSVPNVIGADADAEEITRTVLDRTLKNGLSGDDVERLQQRLSDLGFVPGPADGIYGDQTIKAVWAYEKLVMGRASNNPTGEVTPEMWEELQEPFVIQPRRPNATQDHTEVYLPEQVLAIFHDDVPVMITHMSSGSNEEWCEEVTISPGEYGNRDGTEPLIRGECGISNTPGGVFTVYREVEGIRQSALGGMWDPVYFNYGIAIHGALNVPLQGASHGCIRIPLSISESMQALMDNGDQVFVWDGELEPEENGSPPPTFNWIDPDWEGTTTTTAAEQVTTTTDPASESTVASTTVATTPPVATPRPPTPTTPAVTTPATTTTTTTTTTVADSVAPTPTDPSPDDADGETGVD